MNTFDVKLESLLAVTEYKNFTRAAKFINLTQPAVSQHIAQLEKEYNIKIFNKVGNELLLTSEGEILVKYARRIKSLYDEIETKISDQKKFATSLKIGVTHSSEGNIVPSVLLELTNQNPGTTVKVCSDSVPALLDKLLNYEIDVAVVEGKAANNKLSKTLLDTDTLVVIMAKNHPLSTKNEISFNDLVNEKLILRSSMSATRNLFISSLEEKDLTLDDLNVVLEIDNTSAIKELVMQNKGVAVLPRSVCYNEIKNDSLIAKEIKNQTISTEINLIYRKNYQDKELINEIIKIYKQLALNN